MSEIGSKVTLTQSARLPAFTRKADSRAPRRPPCPLYLRGETCPLSRGGLERHALDRDRDVIGLLAERLGVPHAARRREEGAVVDVDRAADLVERIDHGVDDVGSEDDGV